MPDRVNPQPPAALPAMLSAAEKGDRAALPRRVQPGGRERAAEAAIK
jgi:hypothetical protein